VIKEQTHPSSTGLIISSMHKPQWMEGTYVHILWVWLLPLVYSTGSDGSEALPKHRMQVVPVAWPIHCRIPIHLGHKSVPLTHLVITQQSGRLRSSTVPRSLPERPGQRVL
jgi:hypothetical protein